MTDSLPDKVRSILSDILGLSAEQVAAMDDDTELFGALPELDSMAVAGLLTEMEDRLDIMIDDDDVDGDLFATFGHCGQCQGSVTFEHHSANHDDIHAQTQFLRHLCRHDDTAARNRQNDCLAPAESLKLTGELLAGVGTVMEGHRPPLVPTATPVSVSPACPPLTLMS